MCDDVMAVATPYHPQKQTRPPGPTYFAPSPTTVNKTSNDREETLWLSIPMGLQTPEDLRMMDTS